MSAPSPEELEVAAYVAGAPRLPGRVVCFHAHLAGEKAMKSLEIRRGRAGSVRGSRFCGRRGW